MPVHLQWDEQSADLVRVTFDKYWSLEDLVVVIDHSSRLLAEREEPTFYIVDARSSAGLAKGNVIPHLQRIFTLDFEFAVLVGGSYAAHMLINMIIKLNTTLNRRFKIVRTMGEAEQIIHEKREQLNETP